MKKYKKYSMRWLLRNIRLLINSILFNFPIKIHNGKPVIRIHEKYRPLIKYIKYMLAVVGILTSLITFTSIIDSLILSIGLFVVGWIAEKIGFKYFTLYITPVTKEKINLGPWVGIGFGYLSTSDNHFQIPLVQWIFSDKTVAKSIYDLLLCWTNSKIVDDEKLIYISVVTNTHKGYYYVILAPNLDAKDIKKFNEKIVKEKKSQKETFDDNHMQLFIMQVVRKQFKITQNSYLKTFQSKYRNDVPFVLQFAYAEDSNSKVIPIEELKTLKLFLLKFKEESALTRKDIEYDLTKL